MNRRFQIKKYRDTLLLVIIVSLLTTVIPEFCLEKTDRFSIEQLQPMFPADPRWDIPPLSSSEWLNIEKALEQPYRYLGSGGQCYAFESEDGHYVIKLFKHHWHAPQNWLLGLRLPKPIQSKLEKRYNKVLSKHYRDFDSYKLAYDVLKKESGLIYVHLNKTSTLYKKLFISDKLWINHEIDLDQTEFMIQQRAQLIYPTITALAEKEDFESIQQSFRSILHLLISRCKKGVFDEDHRIHCNIGLLGKEAIFIDVGRFKPDPERSHPEIYLNDLMMMIKEFKKWLNQGYPSLVPLLEKEISDLYADP